MQGRKAKHSVIAKFTAHSTLALRWKLIFCHEFISSLWSRKKNSRSVHFNHNCINYLPEFIQNDTHCYCGLEKQPEEKKCEICHDSMTDMVKRSVRDGVLHEGLANFLSTRYLIDIELKKDDKNLEDLENFKKRMLKEEGLDIKRKELGLGRCKLKVGYCQRLENNAGLGPFIESWTNS